MGHNDPNYDDDDDDDDHDDDDDDDDDDDNDGENYKLLESPETWSFEKALTNIIVKSNGLLNETTYICQISN